MQGVSIPFIIPLDVENGSFILGYGSLIAEIDLYRPDPISSSAWTRRMRPA